jgi:shikimate kinase
MMILLTGPKHAGKTSVGRALAALTGSRFTDLDEFIIERTGKSPRDLYREGGFRQAEAEAFGVLLENAGKGDTLIVAAGGGFADNAGALALLEGQDVRIVYLEVSAAEAWERIRRTAGAEGELPPFLDTPNPEETHRELHARRAGIYRGLAGITVKAGTGDPETVAASVLRELEASG